MAQLLLKPRPDLNQSDLKQQDTIETSVTTVIKGGLKYILKITKRFGLHRQLIQISKQVTQVAMVAANLDVIPEEEPELEPALSTVNLLNIFKQLRYRPRRRIWDVEPLALESQEIKNQEKAVDPAVVQAERIETLALKIRPQLRLHPKPELRINTPALSLRPQSKLIPSLSNVSLGLQLLTISMPEMAPVHAQARAQQAALMTALIIVLEAQRLASQASVRDDLEAVPQQAQMLPRPAFNAPRMRIINNPQRLFVTNPELAPLPESRNTQRLTALGFPLDLVPEKYNCTMMLSPMGDPVSLPHNKEQRFDADAMYRHVRARGTNPYTGSSLTEGELKPDLDLRSEIASYVDDIEKGVWQRRQELGHRNLSRADYEGINDAILGRQSQAQNMTQSTQNPNQDQESASDSTPKPRFK